MIRADGVIASNCVSFQRHANNAKILRIKVMFHIDFGRVFGDALLLDTDSFAITKEFRDEIGTYTINIHQYVSFKHEISFMIHKQ
mmetsp:Transcript_34449/g.55429  ORF Transcript_34449/g.55429 Transcript_34449/m.55429 type:complete len:85 (+) Transcript_34449:1597-1851(+)